MASTEQLERKANRARERLAGRFQDLQYHASPRLVARDLLGAEVPRTAGDIAAALSQQVRRNPLAVALIAAGLGWLIYSDAQARSHARRSSASTAPAARRRRTRKTPKSRSRARAK
jgi:hypothetical protein